ncbi:piggyBac transposable element-derived protein 4-like [Penaeus vannamei]|uniref:piggyBac transposable element-derived protein 4-like n=1 Tax=Penaeus vannamei TaxID=6689 RepID=UPI00387F4202
MNRAYFFEKGYELYLDNWYSSPELFHYLSSRKTNVVGTVRLNRKFMPKDLKVSARGDVDYRTSATGMLALSWMDRKKVHMLSTIHGQDMVDLPPNRRGIVRTKPQVVVDYNVGMKGVDLADQLAASYSTTRRTNKWYQNVFYHLLDMAVLEFCLELIANFLDQPPAYRRRGGLRTPPAATPSPPRRRNAPRQQQRQQVPQGHVLAFNPGRKYRQCRHCRVSRNVVHTRYRCGRCDVSLCLADCFNLWHSPL